MIRHLKTLGLGLLATLAIGAAMAPAASAQFTAEEAPVTIEAGQTTQHVFEASGGTATCNNASFHGEQGTTEAESITITPSYSSCTAFGLSATVSMNGCDYVMYSNGTVDVVCSGSNEITINAGFGACVVHIPGQTGLGSIEYTTGMSGGVHDLTADINISGITGNTTSGFFCPATGGHFSNGTLTGQSTVTARSEWEEPVGITHHGGGGGGHAAATHAAATHAAATHAAATHAAATHAEATHAEATHAEATHAEATHAEATHAEATHAAATHEEATHAEETEQLAFHAEASNAVIIGQGTGVEEFSVDAGSAECSESGYRGAMTSKTAAQLALEPEFASCEAFGFSNATVEGNDCAYVLAVDSEGEGGSFEGSLDIQCPEGKAIEIVGKVRGLVKCTVKIGSQSGLEGVGYANEGSGSSRDVLIDLDLSGVSYTQHAGEGLEKCDGGSFSDGEIRAAPTTIAEDAEKAQLGLWVE